MILGLVSGVGGPSSCSSRRPHSLRSTRATSCHSSRWSPVAAIFGA